MADSYRKGGGQASTISFPEKVTNYSAYLEDAIKINDLTLTLGVRVIRHILQAYNGKKIEYEKYNCKFTVVT